MNRSKAIVLSGLGAFLAALAEALSIPDPRFRIAAYIGALGLWLMCLGLAWE